MNKERSAAKVRLNSFDDLFGSAYRETEQEGQVQEIALSELHEFKGHPFLVLDDEKMQETVESIKSYGVLMPGIVRPRAEGGYEIIAGHRRKHGCELAGLSTMPVFVKDYTDDEATIIMVDSNIQRESLLPSEKARAYAMKYEAIKHQGKKGGNTLAEVGEAAGESAKTVQRYIRLSKLIAPLLEMVDTKILGFLPAVSLSFLSDAEQETIINVVSNPGSITSEKAEQLKNVSAEHTLSVEDIKEIIEKQPDKKKKEPAFIGTEKRLRKYFPDDFPAEKIIDVICSLLEKWDGSFPDGK